jgi:hypothetical protein
VTEKKSRTISSGSENVNRFELPSATRLLSRIATATRLLTGIATRVSTTARLLSGIATTARLLTGVSSRVSAATRLLTGVSAATRLTTTRILLGLVGSVPLFRSHVCSPFASPDATGY